MSVSIESDEAFARRLQAQEIGYRPVSTADAQTPLMRQQNRQNNQNPTLINARMNEINRSWTTVGIILTINIPQIFAAIIVLTIYWTSDKACHFSLISRWKWWAIIAAIRMIVYVGVVLFMQIFRQWLHDRPDQYNKWKSVRNTVDACGLIWFVVGNLWLFGEDNVGCSNPEKSPIYDLCLSMIIINYIQICLPCILAIILVPIFCFCTPCLIRLLARLNDSRQVQGAPQNVIDTIPLITIAENQFANGQESTCPICLSELAVGDRARQLRCHHMFHQQCVDEWLRVNASCPTCRKHIVDDDSQHTNPDNPTDIEQPPSNRNSSNPDRPVGSLMMTGRNTNSNSVNMTANPTATNAIADRNVLL